MMFSDSSWHTCGVEADAVRVAGCSSTPTHQLSVRCCSPCLPRLQECRYYALSLPGAPTACFKSKIRAHCNELQDLANALFEQRPESLTVNAAVCSDFKTVHWKGGGKAGGIVEFMSEVSCCNNCCICQVVRDAMCVLCTLQAAELGATRSGCHPRATLQPTPASRLPFSPPLWLLVNLAGVQAAAPPRFGGHFAAAGGGVRAAPGEQPCFARCVRD